MKWSPYQLQVTVIFSFKQTETAHLEGNILLEWPGQVCHVCVSHHNPILPWVLITPARDARSEVVTRQGEGGSTSSAEPNVLIILEIWQKAQKQVLTDGKCLLTGIYRWGWKTTLGHAKDERTEGAGQVNGRNTAGEQRKTKESTRVEDREKTRESEGKEGETETELDSPPTS